MNSIGSAERDVFRKERGELWQKNQQFLGEKEGTILQKKKKQREREKKGGKKLKH